jgi:hypothetical protein
MHMHMPHGIQSITRLEEEITRIRNGELDHQLSMMLPVRRVPLFHVPGPLFRNPGPLFHNPVPLFHHPVPIFDHQLGMIVPYAPLVPEPHPIIPNDYNTKPVPLSH